jgi:hypothetical protein
MKTDLNNIIEIAKLQGKNILIIGTPRSGTHALGETLNAIDSSSINLGEICKNNGIDLLDDIKQIYNHSTTKIAHIVQLSAKIALSPCVDLLKHHTILINLKRNNKVRQFASWMYFHRTGGVDGKWHNHEPSDTKLQPNSLTVTPEDLDLFVVEQLTDDFFQSDYVLFYEDLRFTSVQYQKNQYSFEIEKIFSNLDYVEHRLANWKYSAVYHEKK